MLPITRSLILLTFLSLTHCVSIQAPEPMAIVPGKTWVLSGKMAVKNEDTQSGESGYIRWQQIGDHYDIEVMGTLGIGAKRIKGNRVTATLLDSSGKMVSAGSPEQLMQENFGWSLPVAAFQAWAEGRPDPHAHFEAHKNSAGKIDWLKQYGWTIAFEEFNAGIPARIILEKSPLRIKLIVNGRKWY